MIAVSAWHLPAFQCFKLFVGSEAGAFHSTCHLHRYCCLDHKGEGGGGVNSAIRGTPDDAQCNVHMQ